jgi:NIMA (never in mitosis gene a)-related kinase
MQALYKNVLRGKYPPIPTHFSIDMRKLIAAMLDLDPAKRPTTVSIMTTEYVI